MSEAEFITPKELAALTRMSLKFVQKHIATRRIPGMVRVGRNWIFRRSEIEKRLSAGSLLLDTIEA